MTNAIANAAQKQGNADRSVEMNYWLERHEYA